MNKIFKIIKNSGDKSGQVMLLTVLIMFGVILSATTIGGYLMLNQLRQAGNAGNSIKALAAADAGMECELFKHFNSEAPADECAIIVQFDATTAPVSLVTAREIGATTTVIRSVGGAARTFRAFEVSIITATSTP